MLLSPRRLPRRFNRRVSPETRRLLQRRKQRRKGYLHDRWRRIRVHIERRAQIWRKSMVKTLIIAVSALIPIFILLLIFAPILRLSQIRIIRSDLRIDISQVQRTLKPLFDRRLPFLSSNDVSSLLTQTIPDLDSVSISKRYPSTISVRLTLDPIVARLEVADPSGTPVVDTGSLKRDYLTNEGIAVRYTPAQVGSGTVLPVIRIVDWSVRPTNGTAPFDPALLTVLPAAERALSEQFGQKALSRTVFVRAREYHFKTAEYTLWFDLRSSLEEQLARYRTFLQTAGKASAKEYVDLRLKDKIVYR